MPLFDAYVVIDWSARACAGQGADSVWIAEMLWRRARAVGGRPVNPPTRAQACALLRRRLASHVDAGRRVLVGFDFPYGWPRGSADAFGLTGRGRPWRRIWTALARAIADDERNRTNRWAVADRLNRALGAGPGPFWNCPASRATAALRPRRGGFPHVARPGLALAEYRLAEAALRRAGRPVQSVWKLFTTGSVGSQMLVGIPRLEALRADARLRAVSRVWPFETGFGPSVAPARGPFVLHAEVWPSLVPCPGGGHPVKDARQVLALARWLAARDAAGGLAPLLDRPAGLDGDDLRACREEEGWILGVAAG